MHPLQFEKTGFILYTIEYEACVHFYEHMLGLPVLYRKEILTCFDFNGSYLMVEIAEERSQTGDPKPERDRTCLRMNVSDVTAACLVLEEYGIQYDYQEHDWGTIAKFRDPDGNLLAFRSAREHEEDINRE